MGAPPLAGWWSRVGASILDGLIALGFLIIPVIIVAVLVSNGSDSGNTTISATRGIDTLFTVAFILIYYPLTTRRSGAHNGQTWGKQALGIRVVRIDGQPFTGGNAVVREFVVKYLLFGWVAIVTCYIATLLNYLWPLWDEKNQALHDKIVNTLVVRA